MTRTPAAILSCGAFIPRLRIDRRAIAQAHAWALPGLKAQGKGERALCSWDEDVITLAVAAARDALADDAPPPAALSLASTTAPFADCQNSVIVASALNLPANTACSDSGGSLRAGLSALAQALESSRDDRQLVLASDRRSARPGSVQELQFGAGAAAFGIGAERDCVARYLGRETVSEPFVDHFRASDQQHDYYWEERWIRDAGVARVVPAAVQRLLARLDRGAGDVAHFGLAGAPGGSDRLVAKKLGMASEALLPNLLDTVGDCGAAHAPLLLAQALEQARPGALILVAAFGQGCEVLAFEKGERACGARRGVSGALAARIGEDNYLKMASFEGALNLDWGMRAETEIKAALTQQFRAADQINAFIGGRCRDCGAVQFPRLPHCIQCGASDSQDPFGLAGQPAQVATYSADWLQYYPAPPLYVGLVQFDVGARLLMEMIEVGGAGIDVGTRLGMHFRVKARDRKRHYSRYFWKAAPLY